MDIRDKLRKIRKYNEISAKDLAELTKTSVNTIQAIENKRMMPNLKTVEKLLTELGYKLDIVKIKLDL